LALGPAEDFSSVSYREFLGVPVFDRTQMKKPNQEVHGPIRVENYPEGRF
jgi:hypothetical protein